MELTKGSQQLHDPQGALRGCYWRMLDTGNSHGTQTVTGGRNERRAKRGRSLRCRPPSRKKWGSRLHCTMRNGRGGASESYWLHPGNTGNASRRRDVCGSIKPGNPTIGDPCEVQEKGPPKVEDRKGLVLRIPRSPSMQWPWATARAPSYK